MSESIELELKRAGRGLGLEQPPPLTDAAAAAGLIDVAYATEDSPLGTLLLAATPRGLIRIAYLLNPGDEAATLERLAARVSPRVLAAPRKLDEPRRELEQYFAGTRDRFELTIDWQLVGSDFGRRVLSAAAEIPFAQTSTYKEVAARAGSPRGFRAAGNALGANPLPIVVPCHRVLHSTGGLGGYTGGLEKKRALLALEQDQLSLPTTG
jgi:methylated-DNA-[protein]-cysteine S-methyltransferase